MDARSPIAPRAPLDPGGRERWRVRVGGVVQGVGFRPFVWRLARELALDGWVRNDAAGVEIEAAGEASRLARFVARLRADAPSVARVHTVDAEVIVTTPQGAAPDSATSTGAGFVVLESAGGRATTAIGPDLAVCDDCLGELFAPDDRRYRYAFTNCTQCGPRFTITRHLPYDRAQTSMAPFALCDACHREYTSPADRRFHAEPNACPACGPQLELLDGAGEIETREVGASSDPIGATLARLGRGEIVAIKALGGFHLACDARSAEAVARLRVRKDREEKPFALLLANVASARRFAEIAPDEEALLRSPERPIVLLRKRADVDALLPGVAPGQAWLGVMLPSTPIQYLLFHEDAGRPSGTAWLDAEQPLALVMTSANPGGEPLVIGNEEAMRRLAGIADAILRHDREILLRCDDSVARREDDTTVFIRRARGYSPRAIPLPRSGPSVLAVGAALKNTLCLTRGAEAFLSPHVGDLDNAATCVALEEAAAHLASILEVTPEAVAHDLHPDFFSTRFAQQLAARLGVPAIAVQHHHAHIAAVCAEHGIESTEPVLGLALDGVGLGDDGGIWGGELLRVEGGRCQRLGHLRHLPLPGGDRAAREPWRMAAAVLACTGHGDDIAARFPDEPNAAGVAELLVRGVRCPPTSSAGRLFDAVAGLLGVRQVQRFEGQAAMELEGLATAHGPVEPLDDGWFLHGGDSLDLLPLLSHLSRLTPSQRAGGAALFHYTLAAALVEWAALCAAKASVSTVALGGGCFLNRILAREVGAGLTALGLRVLRARSAPANDGGIALGQAWVAIESLSSAPGPGASLG